MRGDPENIVKAEPKPKQPRKTVRVSLIILWGIIAISLLMCGQRVNNYYKAAEAERLLNETYGEEVLAAIQNYASNWNSIETNLDPSIRSELAVSSYYLSDFNGILDTTVPENGTICNYPDCLVDGSVEINSIRLLEYSPERFKAIACLTEFKERVTPQGEFIRSLNPLDSRGLFVFVFVADNWKLEGVYDLTIPDDAYRDWEYTSESYREIIGPLPESFSCETRPPN